jgi:hypothetical protein
MDVTLRLPGRILHLVGHARDCDACRNSAAHTLVEAREFLQAEIARAVRVDPSLLARLRDVVGMHSALPSAQGVLDAEVLRHLGRLLQTERLLAIECIEVRRELPDLPRKPLKELPRGVPVPLEDENQKTWVEIELLSGGKPVPNERYRIKVPGGVIEEGTLDAKGRARIVNLEEGVCEVSFPGIDGREWGPA